MEITLTELKDGRWYAEILGTGKPWSLTHVGMCGRTALEAETNIRKVWAMLKEEILKTNIEIGLSFGMRS